MTELSESIKNAVAKQGLDVSAVRAIAESLSGSEDLDVQDCRLVIKSGRLSQPLETFARQHHADLAELVDPRSASRKAVSKATKSKISLATKAALPR
ncbi:hypothetical protein H6G00_00390 [Leptolyngbya sp. FACHB-541]|uniref:hypothetical protein n=1 Tax=Leptolyngbya sp. FACHB-541 TaxID=2692810 RepID=UPI00168A2830|nr:hypothetical protein [Leptolyngbya sp. FACHB-541]MBD1995087.1 hypothetical protein [Leptolyngbya sp. FACHB-541]